MAETTNARVQFSLASVDDWEKVNPKLKQGEIVMAKKANGKALLKVGAIGGATYKESILVWDQDNAETLTSSSKASATAAANSATAAAASESASAASQKAAKTSETNAASSAKSAGDSEAAVKANADSAAKSASAASTSAANSATSASEASSQAKAAASSASNAASSATNAASSATSAASSASGASKSATNASASATDAANSATAAASSAQKAETFNPANFYTKTEADSLHKSLKIEVARITDFTSGVKNAVLTEDIKSALLRNILPATAAAHNSIYRGKDLTAYWNNGGMSKAIQAGTFDDIFPGDYIIKSVTIDGTAYNNIKWIVGDLDYFLHRGVTETTEHHLILFPENNIGTAQMNSTNTTANGYQGSNMWKNIIPKYTTGIVNAFGSDHVLEHDELLTNAMNANAASAAGAGWMGSAYWNWTGSYGKTDGSYPWVKVKVNIFNQAMMFGNHPFASSGQEEGNCNKQLAAFRYGQNFTRANWCWLRDVAGADIFAYATGDGFAGGSAASYVGGVRPYFPLH